MSNDARRALVEFPQHGSITLGHIVSIFRDDWERAADALDELIGAGFVACTGRCGPNVYAYGLTRAGAVTVGAL